MATVSILAVALFTSPVQAKVDQITHNSYQQMLNHDVKQEGASTMGVIQDVIDTTANGVTKAWDGALNIVENWSNDISTGVISYETAEHASNWMGLDVYSLDNELVGETSDMLIAPDGRLKALVISHGGFIGMGSKEVALDFNQISYNNERGHLQVDRLKKTLSVYPPHERNAADNNTTLYSETLHLTDLINTDLREVNNEVIAKINDLRINNGEIVRVMASLYPDFLIPGPSLSVDYDALERVITKDDIYFRLNAEQSELLNIQGETAMK